MIIGSLYTDLKIKKDLSGPEYSRAGKESGFEDELGLIPSITYDPLSLLGAILEQRARNKPLASPKVAPKNIYLVLAL